MTMPQWVEAVKLALEILKQQREGLLTKPQASALLLNIGFNDLIPGNDARAVG